MSERVRSRLEALVQRYSLPPGAESALGELTELLALDPLAATTVRDKDRVIEDHLGDSLVALELPQVRQAATIADLGAGAGVPGLPLAIARPDAEVALVESNGRKCEFISRAASSCGLENVRVVNARAEVWSDGVSWCELVTARALAAPAVVAEYAAPLLRVGGTLVIWRGARDREAEAAGDAAASELGLEPATIVPVEPYRGVRQRHLYLTSKSGPTPARFPRRPGMARKRPLGSDR